MIKEIFSFEFSLLAVQLIYVSDPLRAKNIPQKVWPVATEVTFLASILWNIERDEPGNAGQ